MAKKTKPARVISSFDELDASGIGAGYTPYAVQEDEQAPPAPESSGLIRRIAGDGILTAVKGAIGLTESAVGLADMASGGHVGKALENEDGAIGFRPKQAKEYLDQFYSPEQKAAFAAVQNAANKDDPFLTRVGDIAGAAIRNPSTIVHAVGESLPSIGAGGLIGRGVMAGAAALSPRIATAIAAPLVASQGAQKALSTARIAAAGIGEGVVSAGSTAEQIRQETKDGYLTGGQSLIAAGSGMLTGVLGMASAKAAKALGIGDIDTLLVGGGKIDPALEKGFIRKVLESVLTEGGMEELPQSVQEQVAQNYALGKPLDEGVDNASVMGVLTGGAMGASAQVLSHRKVPEVGPLSRAVNVDGGAAAAQAADIAEPMEPAPPPVAMSPEQEQTLLALANARNKAITDKANGTKDVKTTAEDGTPVTIPGKQPEFLTPAEKEEQAFLAEHGGDVQALARAYPGVLAQPAEQEQQRQQPETSTSRGNDGDNAGAGVESGATDGNGVGANPRGAVADSLGQSGEQAGGSDAGAVTPEKQAITDGYALDKTRDSGVRIFRKTDDAGRHMRAINAEGELITSTSNFGEFTISDSYLEYDGPQAFVVSMDNKRGHLTAKNKESGLLIELSPRADKEFADGIPLAKVLETEFSDAGGIKPDGSKTPHTTTVKKSAPTAKQKSNVTTPVAPAAESLQPKPFDTAAAIAQYRAETLAAQQAEAPSVDELFPLPAAPAVSTLTPSPAAPSEPVDIKHPTTGKPFTTMPGALKAQKLAGDGHEVVKVDGGFVVRAKDTNGTATTTAELDQPTPAQPSADTQAGTGTALAQPGGERAGDVSSAPAVAPGNGSDLPVSAVGSGTDSVAPGDWIKPVVGSDKRPRQVDSVGKDGWVYTKSGDSFKPGQFESTAKPVPTPITGGTGREQGDIPSGNSSTAQLPPTDIRIGDTVRKDGKDYTVTQGIDGGVAATRTVSAQNGVTQEKTIFLKGDEAIRAKLEAASGNSSTAADENPEWTRLPHADRLALNTRAGMSKLVADKIARTPWADITPKTREKITAAMAAPVRGSETENAPVTDKPDTQKITTDKAEMRPYRKPDGSVGYEAVPIEPKAEAVPADKPGVVKVPSTVADAISAQMQKQKGRITRLKNEAEKAGSLEDKRAAQLKVTAAEATLRQMRLKIFDAEDAAVKSVESGDAKQFAQYADLFPSAAEEIAKLTGQNDELDAEMQSYEAKANPTYSGAPAIRQKLETIAQRLGFSVNKSTTGWHASGGMISIPSEDADLSSAVSADHVFAHELGHGIMDKRGVSVKGFPDVELRKRVANWDELVAASKEFRPGVHNHTSDSARKHAKKANEIAADAIASVLIGDKPLTMLQPFMDWLGINKVDLGLQTVDEANAESRAAKESESKAPQAPAEPTPAATENVAKPDAKAVLSEREKAAKAKMFNALGKLATLAGKNTRMNWTQEEEQQLLPIVIELFDGAMELGAVTFQQAVAYVREFISSNLDQDTADSIPFDTLQGAYISVAGRHKDKPVTSKKEVVSFESLAELANTTDKADTSVKDEPVTAEDTPKESLLGANDDTRRNATNDSEPLDQALPGSDSENGTRGSIETGAGLRPTDAQGNGRPESGGSGRGNSLDGSKKPVLPSTPAEIRPLADGPVGKTEDRPQQLSGENPGNFVITDEFKLGQGTDGDKISGNLAAIRTLRQVQKENRYPTKAEQAIMARYVGWGGLKTVFDPKKADATDQYGKAQRELKSLLSPDEYRAANGSIRNAHYTAEGIVDGMWRVMRFMGFKGGRALEPTIGIGNFVGRMPADMAASTEWHASELDTTTGQLAAMLYPEANILASTGFQDAPFADGAFDISVGNPPFGSQQILDKSPNRKHLNGQKIHNYIIAKTGMHLRPGGVMSMVVTHRFLDTANPEARDVLAKDFRFLGAFRLPNDAFKKNAGTDVVTDVVFLQKLGPEEKRERDASWLDVNGSITVDGQAMRVNRYYQDNQSHILGRSAMDGSMQNRSEPEYTVHSDGRDIGKAIDELMQTGFKHMAGVLEQSNNSKALAPAMLTQSDLPIGGVMVNDEGKIIRRELNDANGNAVVQELTPETLWKDQAIDWQALHGAVLDVRTAAKAGKLTQDDANEVLALSRFLFKADGTPSEKPNKAVEAVYKLVEELAKPAKFQWNHDASLLLITGALNRKQLGEDGYKSLKGMLDLRNRTLRLIHAEQAGDEKMEEYRADLNKAYDAFVKENGYLSDSKNANLLEGDVGAEAGIEANYTPSVSPAVAKSSGTPVRAASATKSDIMSRRVNFPYKEITHAESAADSLFASISEHGKVDLPYMAKITNKSVQSVIEELTKGENPQLFRDPETGEYQEAERYLSGNVKHKLRMAQERGMEANIKALEKALPADKTKEQVKPNIRGMWMPPEIFTEFLQAIGYQDAKISVIASQGMLQASGDKLVMADFGVQFRHGKRTPMDMFNSQASGKPIIITYTSAGKTYKDEQGTKEVNALAERMGKVFQEWAYADDNRVKRIVESFNQNMNTHTPRTFDGVKYLKPVGASPSVVLRRTQLDGAWRMMQEKTMLADHVVGAGKTFTLITGIMERRRMGLSRKPMVVVPNHLVTQWARDFYKLYPGAKVLAANPADFAKKNRRRLLARIATGDYDAVIVGHTSIGFMETPTEDLKAIVDEKLAGLKEALAEARKNNESKRTLGQIEDRIDRYEQRLKDLAARPTDDIGIDFKALGIDHLSVDEAHEFKNLEYSTSGDRVVGMNDPNGSKKAFDLYSKVRGLLSRGGGVTFATGTPVSNSLVEIYTMMSYLAHDELVLRGQEHFDSWSGAYAATETRLEYTATQKLKPRRVLAGLNNLSALRQLYEQFADIITMSDLKRIYTEEMVAKNLRDGTNLNTEFPVPKVANGKRELITGDITPAQKEYMDYLVARMGQIEANKSDKEYMRIDNALNVLTDARKMSLDIRIVDPSAKRDENGKVATAAKNIKATYDKWDADRGTQLVFCDLSTPAKTAAKEARSIISATIEQLFGKDLAKQVKKQLEGKTFEQQWKMLVEKSEEISENPDTSEEKRDAIAEFMDKIEDPEATMNVADIGFSVYDDLKTVLMDSGIPESEIAFIHDYNTPDQKEKLFDRVNNGYVRVLIGSSMKMGAGTNAQRRLVALHHMDAPWRPSDVEQREGRIIRQGNTFHTEFNEDGSKNPLFKPDFEVEIKAYSTNQTSDTVMWQILQRKAGAIEQFREGGLDSMEEEGGDSDQYAEFMATSTGNPVFRQKLEAERRLTEIESEIGGALIVRSNAQSFLESYDRRRKAAQLRQEATQSFDPSTASYGGESGTQAEFEAAMKVANDDYLAKYAVWTQKNAAADLAIAKWETEPEATRGDKPSKPTMPSQPDLYTKSVQSASGYARAIGMALNEAGIDKTAKVSMAKGSILITGQTIAQGAYWTAYASNMGEQFTLDSSGAQKASASTRIIQALTPFSISNALKVKATGYERDVADLDRGKAEALKGSKLEVDTSQRDAARVELRWFTAQVAFAEVQADIDRGATKNRYIERDKRRNISQNKAVALTDPATHTIDGVKYTTTGLNAHSGYQAVSQATRDSDGVPAIIVLTDKEKGTFSVVMQPKNLRKADKSTNLAQTGAPEGNTSDVLFSQNLVAPKSSGPKPTLEQIQGFVEKILQVAKNVIPVSVIASPHEIAGVKVPVGTKPTGAVVDGRIYLFADNIGSVGSAYVTLFHEVFHLGLQKVIPAEDYAAMLKQFANSPLVAKYIRLWKDSAEGVQKAKTMPSQNYEALANEEALAMVSETLAANDGMGTKNLPGLAKLMLNWLAKVADRIGMPVDFSNWVRDLTRTEAERFVNDMVRAVLGGDKILGRTQAKYGTTLAEMTAQTRLSAGKATNQTDSMAFKAWFSGSKVVDAEGKPLMVYHGTSADFAIFKPSHGDFGDGIYMTSDAAEASDYANNWSPTTAKDGANVMPVYASLQNPYYTTPEDRKLDSDVVRKKAEKLGHDGIIRTWKNSDQIHVIAFNPTQIKSAIGNNGNFDASNPDIRFSQGLGGTLSSAANSARDVNLPAGYKVADLFQGEGRLSYWHKSVGTMYNLAQRSPPFKRVFDSVQNFLNDVSFYAAEAADLAPSILPKLDKITDIAKSPLSAADTKALSRPVFEGTLTWGRDSTGTVKPMEEIEAALEELPLDERAHMLLQGRHVAPAVLRMWQGLPQDQYEAIINGKFEREFMKPGVVFKPAELREHFGMTDAQVAIYQEFRKATDKSIDNLAISEMLNYAGKDALPVREAVLASGSVQEAGQTLRDYLVSLTEMEPERDEALSATAAKMLDIAAHATDMKDRGYAPLSRFGNYTLEATLPTGERYFSLFETDRERNKMARMLTSQGATGVSAGTMSQESYKLLNGITPETAALFGEMLGLESQGSEAKDLAFQEYIKRGTANRSAMKRLLQRKGIAGFSEDSGRVLAGFIYSNSRRTSSNLHAKETTEAVSAIPKEQGELKDTAVKLHEYVSNPAEEAQAFRGILFAQYLGGSVASAMVNATQPFTVTLPYLTQFGGVKKAAAQMVAAVRDATKDTTGNAALDAALKKAEEDGIVSPQEVHSLQAQAMGRAQLQAGDGTTMGNALAMGNNAISKMSLAWGKVFGLAEQFNRRTTFIAAYRTAIEQGIANPAKFAEKAVMETQFVYNKGNKPRWGRGAIGATLFTFKQYSVNYLEMVHRMATAGEPGSPERAAGRKAAALAIAILFMLAGSEGLPFVEDIEDLLDGALQRMGYNFSSKQSMKAFLVTQLGKDGAEFVTSGISGLPGAPIDVSGRLGMGNLIPGTGLFQKKTDHTRDLMELAGPAGDMIKRTGQATEQLLGGNVVGAAKTIAPTAARNLDKAYDMTKTGMYRDDKGSKIIDTDGFEAVAKAIGFQPRSVKNVQDASREVQRAKAQYTLASGEIRAKMAQAIFMGDDDMKQSARDDVMAWNRNNPDQRMTIDMPTVLRKVREMRKNKEQRIADTAPKALRSQVREQLRGELH